MDPSLIVRQASETQTADPEAGEPRKKTNAELQRAKLAEQAKKIEQERYRHLGGGTVGTHRDSVCRARLLLYSTETPFCNDAMLYELSGAAIRTNTCKTHSKDVG